MYLTVVANSVIDTNTAGDHVIYCLHINVTAHTMTLYGHVTLSVTSCYVISCVKKPSNSKKNCWRSILNVVTSQLWRHRVTWRHRWPMATFL